MTPTKQKQAESDAKSDAKKLALLLLLLFQRKTVKVGTVLTPKFAVLHSDTADQVRKITFDESSMKFRIDGRAVSVTTIRMYLQRIQDKGARKLATITLQLEKGEISLAAWQREFERTITSSHILAAALVLGSIGDAVKHRLVQERIAEQIEFLDAFGQAVRDRQAGSFGKIRSRAKSYLQAVHVTFANLELQQRIALGIQAEARNVLRPAEHCLRGPNDPADLPICTELTKQGWMPIDEMPPIGTRKCKIWCKCYIEYR
jgi:hypothetical protein